MIKWLRHDFNYDPDPKTRHFHLLNTPIFLLQKEAGELLLAELFFFTNVDFVRALDPIPFNTYLLKQL